MKLGQNCLLGFGAVLAIRFCACHSSSREQTAPAKDFTIIFGRGGGFTGMAEGYIIHGDGKIEKWSGFYFRRDKLETVGTAKPEALLPLRQMFEARAFKQPYQQTGNMTTRVWCISGGDTTVVSWPGLEPGKDVPPALQDFYGKLMSAVQSASK